MKVSAVITNYDTWPLSLRCVQALDRHSRGALSEIVIVDDGSKSEPPAELPASVRVIKNPRNLGYQASVNVGFRAVTGDWVLLLDSDAFPLMDVVEPLNRAFSAAPGLGAVSLGTVDELGRATASAQDEPDAFGFLLGPRLEGPYMSLRRLWDGPRLVVYSCALAVRRAAFESIGGFDEDFDFLDADLDFSMRLSRAGWETRLDPSLTVFHKGSGSPQTQSKRVLRCYRNRWKLLEKHRKLGARGLLKASLLARHLAEVETLLVLIGTARDDARRELYKEKLRVRRRLIESMWSGYRDAVQ